MKKILAMLLLLMTAFAGQGSAAPGGEVEEVFLFSAVGAYQKLLEESVQKFNEGEGAAKGVRIVMETNIDNYKEVCNTMIQSGNPPDLLWAYDSADWIAAGWTKNLYDIPEVADMIERFEPYFIQGVNVHGDNLVALPLEVLPLKMVYNREIFEKSGLSGPPETWDELVEYARIITEAGDGEFYGFGWTTMWTWSWTRLAMKTHMSSTGKGWFDNSTGMYDFRPFKTSIEGIAKMYQEGSMFPSPMDQHIDPIRNRFAEGRVGMEFAPAYDISVYNVQFPCDFDWGVCEAPSFEPGGLKYKGIYLNRANFSISSSVSDDRMWAVVEAFRFLHSPELYRTLYEASAIIPHEMSIVASADTSNSLKNWAEMAQTNNYMGMPPFPDLLLELEGDDLALTFERIMLGRATFDAEVDALNERYNAAYQRGKSQGRIDPSIYEFPVDMTRD